MSSATNNNSTSGPSVGSNPLSAPTQPSSYSPYQINENVKSIASPSIPTAPAASNPNYHHYYSHQSFQQQQPQASYSPAVQYANENEYFVNGSAQNSNLSHDSNLREWIWMFADTYYTGIHNDIENTYLFYKKDSIAIHGIEGENVSSKKGQAEIRTLFTSEHFKDCRFRITNIDYQNFAKDMIVIQVIGELANNDEFAKTFVQTFIMAGADRGYYILSDILRFLNEDENGIVATDEEPVSVSPSQPQTVEKTPDSAPAEVAPNTNETEVPSAEVTESEAEPVTTEEPVSEPAVKETESATSEPAKEESAAPVAATEPEEKSETVAATVEEPSVATDEQPTSNTELEVSAKAEDTVPVDSEVAPASEDSSSVADSSEPEQQVESATTDEATETVSSTPATSTPTGPKSYAFVASTASSQPITDMTPKPKPKSVPATKTVKRASVSNIEGAGVSTSNNTNSVSNTTNPSTNRNKIPFHSVYIKNSDNIPEKILRAALTQNFGEVIHFQARPDKGAVYVDFETEEAMLNALKKRNLTIPNYRTILIDKRVRKGNKNGQNGFSNGGGYYNNNNGSNSGNNNATSNGYKSGNKKTQRRNGFFNQANDKN